MLPRLQAEERLTSIDNVALGSGALDEKSTKRAIADLERAADVKRARPARANSAALAKAGIGIRGAPAPAKEAATNE